MPQLEQGQILLVDDDQSVLRSYLSVLGRHGWGARTARDGLEALGHELAHVLQQRAGRVPGTGVTEDPALEAEAHEAGERVALGTTAEGVGIDVTLVDFEGAGAMDG